MCSPAYKGHDDLTSSPPSSTPNSLPFGAAQQEISSCCFQCTIPASPYWEGTGCHNQGTAAFKRTKKTNSATQNLIVASLYNTIASSQHLFSRLQHKAGHYEKLQMPVFSNSSLLFSSGNVAQPSIFRSLYTVTQVLLTPAHVQVNERSGFDSATYVFELFFSLPCCRQHTLELQCFPSCWRDLHTYTGTLVPMHWATCT